MEPILCGGKGVFAQPPHSAHKWAPFVFVLIFSSEFEPRILPLQKERINKIALPQTYHLSVIELDDGGAKTSGYKTRCL